MQAVAVTEQRRRQGRTLSAWPYASAFFRCLNGSRRISLTDLRFFAPALTKEEFHGNRLLWLAAVDKLIETHIMRLLISLWDVGTVFFTIYPQVFRHEKSSIYYKYIEPLSYCFSISFKILIITVYGFMKWYICKCLFCKVYLLDLSYNRNAKPMTGSNELRFNLTQIRG